MVVRVDGGLGEGGGQVLRTAVALAALTGQDLEVHDIRAGRPNPGMAPQHLAAVRAVGAFCDAEMEGADLGSTDLRFCPGPVKGGSYRIDVGTAGSVSLVLQSCLLSMCRCKEFFQLEVRGGTDVQMAPPIDHLGMVLIPLLGRMGYRLDMKLEARGFYPEGGGMVRLSGIGTDDLTGLSLLDKGRFLGIEGVAYAQGLPNDVPQRMAMECKKLLVKEQTVRMKVERTDGLSTGAGLVLSARYENTLLGASKLGERGLRSERVAQIACHDLMREMGGPTLDVHTADQMVPYMALSGRTSEFRVRELTSHLQTQMWLLPQFLPVMFDVDNGIPTRIRVVPSRT